MTRYPASLKDVKTQVAGQEADFRKRAHDLLDSIMLGGTGATRWAMLVDLATEAYARHTAVHELWRAKEAEDWTAKERKKRAKRRRRR